MKKCRRAQNDFFPLNGLFSAVKRERFAWIMTSTVCWMQSRYFVRSIAKCHVRIVMASRSRNCCWCTKQTNIHEFCYRHYMLPVKHVQVFTWKIFLWYWLPRYFADLFDLFTGFSAASFVGGSFNFEHQLKVSYSRDHVNWSFIRNEKIRCTRHGNGTGSVE